MKRIIRCAGILLLCGALMCPVAEARGRNERGREHPQKTQPASRPGNNGRPSHGNGGGHNRPATPQRPAQRPENNRPGNNRPGNHNPGNNRPGNNRPDNNRPGNNHPGNNRPGNHHPENNRPGNNRPGHISGGNHGNNHRPDYRPQRPPQAGHHHPGHHHPGYMKPMPPHHGWFRPAPPPRWRPSHHWRPFRSILGITLGTTINLSINALINSGYTINSYNNNSVLVSNVPMLNMMWPEAFLFYNDLGGLCGSRFMYPTSYYDMSRYNNTYASLVGAYGQPVSIQNNAAGMEATWWGTGNQFIRLSFGSGAGGWVTTLSFGN